jgi:hypothetical protein
MVGRLMRAPGGLVDVEFEDKEQQRVHWGAVGKEKRSEDRGPSRRPAFPTPSVFYLAVQIVGAVIIRAVTGDREVRSE